MQRNSPFDSSTPVHEADQQGYPDIIVDCQVLGSVGKINNQANGFDQFDRRTHTETPKFRVEGRGDNLQRMFSCVDLTTAMQLKP